MASHGKKRHTKRIAMPVANPAARKVKKWMKTTSPGAHGKKHSMPLLSAIRDLLAVVENDREAKKILNAGEVQVDSRVIRDKGFPVGLMDVISIPKAKLAKTLIFSNSKLRAVDGTAGEKLCKVIGKTKLKGGNIQVNLHDSRNLLLSKTSLKTGDTVKIHVPNQKVAEEIKLEKGVKCYVSSGRHSGKTGTLIEIVEFPGSTAPNAVLKAEDGTQFITLKEYVFAVDSNFKV